MIIEMLKLKCCICGKEFTGEIFSDICKNLRCKREYRNSKLPVLICSICNKPIKRTRINQVPAHNGTCRKIYNKHYLHQYYSHRRVSDPGWAKERSLKTARLSREKHAKKHEDIMKNGILCKHCKKNFIPDSQRIKVCRKCKDKIHKENLAKWSKQSKYRYNNEPEFREKVKISHKNWLDKNRGKFYKYQKEWRDKNKDKVHKSQKEGHHKNRDKVNKYQVERRKRLYHKEIKRQKEYRKRKKIDGGDKNAVQS